MTDVQDTPVASVCLAYKVCQKCKAEKAVSEFANNKKRNDGIQAWCRQCVNVYYKNNRDKALQRSQKWYIENTDYKKSYDKEYREINHSKIKEKEKARYENNKEKWVAYREANRERIAARAKDHYNANKDRFAAYRKENAERRANQNRQYRKADPLSFRRRCHIRRARLASSNENYEPGYVKVLFRLQLGKCAICRISIKSGYHVDHIKPISKGGTNGKDNIQLLCRTCNLTKSAADPIEFMQSRGFLL